MGWSFTWLSSFDNDFNRDFGVEFSEEEVEKKSAGYNYAVRDPFDTQREGVSVFSKDESGAVYHTYSAYARGIDLLNGTHNYIDLTPKGRDEGEGNMAWLRRHDEY